MTALYRLLQVLITMPPFFFAQRYRDKDNPLYSVAPIHDSAMARAFRLPPFFSCGGWLDRLQLAIMWLGEYETKSVLHNDDLDGLMCLLSGRKQWYIVDKRHWKKIESDECGWNVADKTGKGYGAFARINVDDVRSELRECYNSIEWYHADLEPGDCLLTPLGWYVTPPLHIEIDTCYPCRCYSHA